MEKEKIIAEVIVDLYEMRATTMPYKPEHYEKVYNAFKYQFFTTAIAHIYDKYQIKGDTVEEVIRQRSFNSIIEKE